MGLAEAAVLFWRSGLESADYGRKIPVNEKRRRYARPHAGMKTSASGGILEMPPEAM
jgi:hypothetical protein